MVLETEPIGQVDRELASRQGAEYEPRKRGPSTFRQRDVIAAIRAVEAAGHRLGRVEIGRDGKIVIIPARGQPEREPNEWDAALS